MCREFAQLSSKALQQSIREEEEVSRKKLESLGVIFDDVQAFIQASEPTQELRLVLENLDARGLSPFVRIDYNVIRGLAYYTGVVFEAFDLKGEFRAIAGGGRYDNLVKSVSGGKVDLPALGFGMGDVVLLELLKARKRLPVFSANLDAVLLIDDESFRSEALRLVQDLRDKGLSIDYSLTPLKFDKQFKRALDLNPRTTIRLERNADGTLQFRVKTLADRSEKILQRAELI